MSSSPGSLHGGTGTNGIRRLPSQRQGSGGSRSGRVFWSIVAILVFLLLVANPLGTHFLVSLWWFQEVGYSSVFTRSLLAPVLLGLSGAVVAFICLRGAAAIVARLAARAGRQDRYTRPLRLIVTAISLILAVAMGAGLSSNWMTYLLAFNQVPFKIADPILHNDVALYVFALPAWTDALGWLSGVLIWMGLLSLILMYILDLSSRLQVGVAGNTDSGHGFDPNNPLTMLTGGRNGNVVIGAPNLGITLASLQPYRRLVALWMAVVAVFLAASNWIARYATIATPEGRIAGPGFVATHAMLPALTIMTIVSLVAAGVLLLSALRGSRWRALILLPIGWIILWILFVGLIPAAVQTFIVAPAELQQQSPYIANDIQMTRLAYGLNNVTTEDFPASTLSASVLAANRPTLNNLRVLDSDPFLTASKQKQEIRSYYDFSNAQIDRYQVGGSLRQVLIAAREIQTDNLPDTAKTWQNTRLTYTHGYGLVMAPVNQVDTDGSPLYWIKDIPPQNNPAIPEAADLPTVSQPRIYFGMETNGDVFVHTNAPEFDRSTADKEYYASYTGSAGIPLGGLLQRAVWISYFNSPIDVGTSSYLTASSKVLVHRNVMDRVSQIAPFLTLEDAPYLVLDGKGKQWWMLDAYTTSSSFPYSYQDVLAGYTGPTTGSPSNTGGTIDQPTINYVRNSIKITIDPFNGTVRFYLADPSDPLALAYGKAFPGLLRPLSEMPADLRQHIRVPQSLFEVQSDVYRQYHMTDPQVFYNQEDKWDLPTDRDGSPMPSYYTVTKLPDGSQEEFVLVRPFTPLTKQNMISLMVARSDGTHYGQIVVYRFPIGRQILGPVQFNSNIDQNPTMSSSLTLWNQQGSTVTRGNVIVAPIGQGLLYLEPIYLQAATSPIPQLQRVAMYANGNLVWGTSLDDAITQLFGTNASASTTTTPNQSGAAGSGTGTKTGSTGKTPQGSLADLQAINQHLTAAQKAIAAGNYVEYGKQMQQVRAILNRALGQSGP